MFWNRNYCQLSENGTHSNVICLVQLGQGGENACDGLGRVDLLLGVSECERRLGEGLVQVDGDVGALSLGKLMLSAFTALPPPLESIIRAMPPG